jgi:hypothetical protein
MSIKCFLATLLAVCTAAYSMHVVIAIDFRGWMIRICRVSDAGKSNDDSEFHLPVFVFVFTKFRKLPNAKQVRSMFISLPVSWQ